MPGLPVQIDARLMELYAGVFEGRLRSELAAAYPTELARWLGGDDDFAPNSGLFQAMAKTLQGDLTGLKFELDNARKDVRYYTHLAENLAIPSVMGEAVHQSLSIASALGHGKKLVPSLVEAQEQLAQVQLVPR